MQCGLADTLVCWEFLLHKQPKSQDEPEELTERWMTWVSQSQSLLLAHPRHLPEIIQASHLVITIPVQRRRAAYHKRCKLKLG